MIKYQMGFKYQLVAQYRDNIGVKIPNEVKYAWFSITPTGEICIRKGYAWDGPSGPTIDTRNFMRGSLVHDVLYQAIRLELLPQEFRQTADAILRDICIEDGMSRIRAWWVYTGVRIGAGPAAMPSAERQVMVAP
jgi:hypothetical protein